MSTLARRVIAQSVGGLLTALVVVGLGTGALLYVRQTHAVDAALYAAALAEAHPWSEERWDTEHAHSVVRVRPWHAGDPLVEDALAWQAIGTEEPLWLVRDDRRILLLAVEPPEALDGDEAGHAHQLLVATAPRVTVFRATGGFALVYGLVAALTAALTALLLARALGRSMEPLRRASRELDTIRGLEAGARLTSDGRTAEVDRVIASANDLLDRLEAASQSQRSFTAEAAHELRTPVTVLLGELDLALRQPRDADAYREVIVRADRQARRLRDLVEGLLALARLDAGHASHGREVERMSAVVHQALQQERPTLAAAGNTVQMTLGEDPEVSLHASLVRIAISNLLRNAAIHAPGTPVTLRVDRDGAFVLVEVVDAGPGVEEAEREALFDRFRRGDRRRPGLGLGLPLAREIARRHGGDLTLHDGPEGGLLARFCLHAGASHQPLMSD